MRRGERGRVCIFYVVCSLLLLFHGGTLYMHTSLPGEKRRGRERDGGGGGISIRSTSSKDAAHISANNLWPGINCPKWPMFDS